jgi:hypothetical protein
MGPFTTPMAKAMTMASLGCSLRIKLFGLSLLSIGLCLLCCRCSLCIEDRYYLESSTSGFETIGVGLILIGSKMFMPTRTDRTACA